MLESRELQHFGKQIDHLNTLMNTYMMIDHGQVKQDAGKALVHLIGSAHTLMDNVNALSQINFGKKLRTKDVTSILISNEPVPKISKHPLFPKNK